MVAAVAEDAVALLPLVMERGTALQQLALHHRKADVEQQRGNAQLHPITLNIWLSTNIL